MVGIRRNLELRKSLAGIERTIAHREGQRPQGKSTSKDLKHICNGHAGAEVAQSQSKLVVRGIR
jgi:hypothetical protein